MKIIKDVYLDNYSVSALPLHFWVKKRPLDKGVHSILVSHEILNARKTFLTAGDATIHPATNTLIENTKRSISEILDLKNLDNFFTKRTKKFILTARENIH